MYMLQIRASGHFLVFVIRYDNMIIIRSALILLTASLFIAGCGASKKTAVSGKAPTVKSAVLQVNDVNTLGDNPDKPILIFFHTDWCKFCQNMKQTTFRDQEVIRYLNERFYYVSFNAEQKSEVRFGGNTFKFIPRGGNSGTHQFAEIMATTDGELSYPTIVVLNRNLEVVFKYNSFLSARELIPVLRDVEQNYL